MPTDTEKAYLAGLLDGEGHIGIMLAKQRANGEWRTHALIVTVANTHLSTLRWAQETWPSGRTVVRTQPKQRVPIGNLRWSSSGAAALLRDVQPYLRIKTAQAALGLQFANELAQREYRTKAVTEAEWERREDLRIAIRQINRPDPTLQRMPFPISRYERSCLYCGTTFVVVDGNRRLYCNRKCYQKERWRRAKARQTAE